MPDPKDQTPEPELAATPSQDQTAGVTPQDAASPVLVPIPAVPQPVPAGLTITHLEDFFQELRSNLGPRIESQHFNILNEVVDGFKARIAALFQKEA